MNTSKQQLKNLEELKKHLEGLKCKPVVIAFGGAMYSGKSSVAKKLSESKTLTERYALIYRMSFAGALKSMVNAFFEYMGYEPPSDKTTNIYKNKTLRQFYQTLGSGWGRDLIGDDFWSLAVANKIIDICEANTNEEVFFIIDDLRFENEFNILSIFKPLVLEVIRDGVSYTKEHNSENGIQHLIDEDCKIRTETFEGKEEIDNELNRAVTEVIERIDLSFGMHIESRSL